MNNTDNTTANTETTTPAPVKVKHDGPGRPRYSPLIPKGNFTFTDFEIVNGVKPNGKGKNCTTLTLRKWLKNDLYILDDNGEIVRANAKSKVMRVKDLLANPNSKKGLGRKQLVYVAREGTPTVEMEKSTLVIATESTVKTAKVAKAKTAKAKTAKAKKTKTAKVVKAKKVKVVKAKKVKVADAPAPAPAPVDAISESTKAYEANKAALLAPVANITPDAPAPAPAPVAETEQPAEPVTT
jgi:hypothetical protein